MAYKDKEKQRTARAIYAAKRRVQEPMTVLRLKLESVARARTRALEIVLEFKITGCVDCGESDSVVLDCHHRDQEKKSFGISKRIRSGVAEATLRKELAKCEVLCANCHRRRHARERGCTSTLPPWPTLMSKA